MFYIMSEKSEIAYMGAIGIFNEIINYSFEIF